METMGQTESDNALNIFDLQKQADDLHKRIGNLVVQKVKADLPNKAFQDKMIKDNKQYSQDFTDLMNQLKVIEDKMKSIQGG